MIKMIIHFNGHQTHSFVHIACGEGSLDALLVEYCFSLRWSFAIVCEKVNAPTTLPFWIRFKAFQDFKNKPRVIMSLCTA